MPAIIPNSSILLSNFLRSNSDISLLWCILRGIRDGRIRDPNSRFLGAKKRRQLIAGRCSPSHSRARVPPVECTHPRAEIEIERFLGRIGSVRVLRALLSTGKSEIFLSTAVGKAARLHNGTCAENTSAFSKNSRKTFYTFSDRKRNNRRNC